MTLHTAKGEWRIGFVLTIVTILMWGTLAIALKGLLPVMDGITVTFYRFVLSGVCVAIWVLPRGHLAPRKRMTRKTIILLFTAAIGMTSCYLFYVFGLEYLSPSAATVVVQLSPMLLLLGSLLVYREPFARVQWIGFAIFSIGLMLFFNQRYEELFGHFSAYAFGVLLIICSSVSWAGYALVQKQLLQTFSSQAIMLILYLVCGLALLPLSHPEQLLLLTPSQIFLLLFCALNTLIGYGAFAEALEHWEASRVSAAITVVPLVTVGGMYVVTAVFPTYLTPEGLNPLSVFGACLVVFGAMAASLFKPAQKL
jgi:drug/metabolite transporter (DMT)-like permease